MDSGHSSQAWWEATGTWPAISVGTLGGLLGVVWPTGDGRA